MSGLAPRNNTLVSLVCGGDSWDENPGVMGMNVGFFGFEIF